MMIRVMMAFTGFKKEPKLREKTYYFLESVGIQGAIEDALKAGIREFQRQPSEVYAETGFKKATVYKSHEVPPFIDDEGE